MVAAALPTLLEIQGLDTRADQLRHRRETLTERAELRAAEAEVQTLEAELAGVTTQAHDLQRSQRRYEDEVASLEARAAGAEGQLYSGTVTAPRELQALQDEVASLRRRIGGLEDELLAVMVETEPVTAEMDRITAALEAATIRRDAARAAVAAGEAAIESDLTVVRDARAGLIADVPDQLLSRYERIRSRAGGVGVARLEGNRCTGCHLTLPNRELDEVRRAPADEVVVHEECGRILVRD